MTHTKVPRAERKAYKLSPTAWRMLKDVALRVLSGHATPSMKHSACKPLVDRGLLVVDEAPERTRNYYGPVELTDLGKRVYSRLSVGPFCSICGKPVAFVRCVSRPGGKLECEPCARIK